jgi:hypothetical protein
VIGWRLESDGVVIGFAHILLQRIKNVRGDPRGAGVDGSGAKSVETE